MQSLPPAEEAEGQAGGGAGEELLCGSCAGGQGTAACGKHGSEFIEYKCRFCCRSGCSQHAHLQRVSCSEVQRHADSKQCRAQAVTLLSSTMLMEATWWMTRTQLLNAAITS